MVDLLDKIEAAYSVDMRVVRWVARKAHKMADQMANLKVSSIDSELAILAADVMVSHLNWNWVVEWK